MKRGTFPASLYGRTAAALSLPGVKLALRAVKLDRRRLRCDGLYVVDDYPIAALCRALLAAGQPDGPLLVVWADRSPACYVQSIHASAWSAQQLAR